MITYRKTRQDEWVAFGPVAEFPALQPGTTPEIKVTKKSGEVKAERVRDYGKPFTAAGVTCRYAYLVPQERPARRRQEPRPASRCDRCRCHRQANAGQPGSIMYDGCDYCGCESF